MVIVNTFVYSEREKRVAAVKKASTLSTMESRVKVGLFSEFTP